MFRALLLFEIRYHLKSPLLYITVGILFASTFGAIVSDSVVIGGSIGQVNRNSPYVIVQFLSIMSLLAIFVVTAFVASSVLRDFESGSHELFFSRPVRKTDYLLGRFLGSLIVSFAVFLGPVLGILIGSAMPWLEPERIGPFMVEPYLFGLLVMVLPNVLFLSALYFTLAGLTRSMLATYLGVVATFVLYGLAGFLTRDIANDTLGAVLDPFGLTALERVTRYFTAAERNTIVPDFDGLLLYNRLLWICLAVIILAFGVWRFSYQRATATRRRWFRRAAMPVQQNGLPEAVHLAAAPAPRSAGRSFALRDALQMLVQQTRLETTGVLKSIPFIVMLGFGLFNLIGRAAGDTEMYGTHVYPVTHMMLSALDGSYLFLLVIILTFYAGELVWRERSQQLHEVYDALPAPSWVFLSSKMLALLAVVVVFALGGVLAAIGFQLANGYTHIELGLYTTGILTTLVPFAMIAVLAITVQVLAGNKFIGYLGMIIFLLSYPTLEALDWQHHLYRFATSPSITYSDMNGYGHFVAPTLWFWAYWGFCCVILLALCILFWVRGSETSWRLRRRLARYRLRGPVRAMLAVGLVGFITTGTFIFYNTNILNDYIPNDALEALQARYEKDYRQYRDMAQPRVTDVYADVDIYPAERRVEIRGRYQLLNRGDETISELHLNLTPQIRVNSLTLPTHTLKLDDSELGVRIYELEQPLAPGASMQLEFDLSVVHRGFVNHGSNTRVVYNGTFFDSSQYFPMLGYDESRQLIDRNARRRHDLPLVYRMAKVDDLFARRNTYVTSDADWVNFETVVSTSADQIAIAPGYLQREWQEDGRRYFHYKMDAPTLNFFSFQSADWQVHHDSWNDVAIDVYYNKHHDYNVQRMVDGVKSTLAYCTANFSPYQHRQMRIIEFPRYARFAQSFPNTVPFSESIGFIARIEDEDDIDYAFYVAAHEVAHQWWAHQVIGGNVQGATLMSEALSQYTALMVMEQEYGREKMQRFLKYELDRYLRGRAGELVEETPLLLVENQGYIHYNKGSVVMYALRDYLGEERLNQALAEYARRTAFQNPPYTNSYEFMEALRDTFGSEADQLFADMIESITLFSNRTERAVATRLDDGRYQVELTVEARKLRADGAGNETEIPIDDWIDIGVLGEDSSDILYLEKHHITEEETTFTLVVDKEPQRAGIDPLNKLIDRVSDDNISPVKTG